MFKKSGGKKRPDTSTVCIYEKLLFKGRMEQCGEVIILDKHDMCELIGELFRIPKDSRGKVLNDMVEYGMIVQVSRGRAGIKYRILG